MGNVVIIGTFATLAFLSFILVTTDRKHQQKKVSRLMQQLANTLGLEFHPRPLGKWNQKMNFADASGEIDQLPVHVYVDKEHDGKSETNYLCIEVHCQNAAFPAFQVYKKNVFAKFAHQVFAHNSSDEYEDLAEAKFVFETKRKVYTKTLLDNRELSKAMLDAEELIKGVFDFQSGRLVYKEEVSGFDECKVNQADQLVCLVVQMAETIDNGI